MTIHTDGWWPFVEPVEMNLAQICLNCAILGYVLFHGSQLISDGSELLILVPRFSSIVGSIVLPVLGAVPDGVMVLFSGVGENPQKDVAVGIGTLAGSTIMLLTLPWFIAVLFGRVNLKDGVPTYKRPLGDADWEKISPHSDFGLWTTGVALSQEIRDNGKIMLMSLAAYPVIQIPALIVSKPWEQLPRSERLAMRGEETQFEHVWSLIGLIVCSILFAYYMKVCWEVDGGTEDKIAGTHVKAIQKGTLTLRGAMHRFREERIGGLLTDKGQLREELLDKAALEKVRWLCKILAPFFAYYDINGDNQIDFNEFRMIFKDIRGFGSKQLQKELFDTADTQHTGAICFEEFAACMMAYAMDPVSDVKEETVARWTSAPMTATRSEPDTASREEEGRVRSRLKDAEPYAPRIEVPDDMVQDGGDDEDEEEEEKEDMPQDLEDLEPDEQQRRILTRAFAKMGLGSILILVFSDPMVDVMAEMGDRLHISAFYVSFVLAPMASNASEMISAYNYAAKHTTKGITTALSTLEGAAVMNNTFVLGVFMGLIYFNGLAWEFTAETISIVSIELMLGLSVIFKKKQTLMDGFIVLSFYPVSMGIVAFLEKVVGLD